MEGLLSQPKRLRNIYSVISLLKLCNIITAISDETINIIAIAQHNTMIYLINYLFI